MREKYRIHVHYYTASYKATSPPVKVPATEAEFPLWMAKLILCFRNMRERESPERDAKREPISLQIAAADSPQVPRVSIAMGTNSIFPSWDSREYLARLFLSACAAAEPAAVAEEATCEGSNVSGQVKSQISGLPWLQGIFLHMSAKWSNVTAIG